MYYPERYKQLKIVPSDAQGNPLPSSWTHAYPPYGFFEAALFELGNGDVYGFYWPIGRENHEPIICLTAHDSWNLLPVASSLEGLLKVRTAQGDLTKGWEEEDLLEDDDGYEDPDLDVVRQLAAELQLDLSITNMESDLSTSQRLILDPFSPLALYERAKEFISQDQFPEAENCLIQALEVLPEYTHARFLLASVHRRNRKVENAALLMLTVLSSPVCFGTGRHQSLAWLQRLKDEDFPMFSNDPLWQARHELTLATGVKTNDDFLIYESTVSTYLEQGRGIDAVRLRTLIGELMFMETTSFRERYGYTPETHLQRLASNLQQAGLHQRLAAIPGKNTGHSSKIKRN